ncbi:MULTISPECIES: alpha/beta fold hydrolase [unclassified Streptomyces]|uniref:alpha/beta fold hydrolase n=1 Tax=unclassified Streptomyces TaxID=2593676 RepID=UPI002E80C2C8|nr:alpha/beta fold hydrolase [Streptomyces sp. NBC_00589]WTI36063.1 alpha/beta fold hydrolase [Streptomyces sp. NBC_00775]WUB30263.1 alpha/beta fold hydrolase [Streptomyces sp. NBC_00589]
MTTHGIHHRTTTVRGHEIHYREAGPADAPVLLLLHGFPTSSHMFRDLIPLLSDLPHSRLRSSGGTPIRLIAPDHLGFGRSAAPAATAFPYTFDQLAEITGEFTELLGLKEYALYIQDYGAPIGLRLALAHPERVTAVITQNGNAYEEGLGAEAWAPVLALIAGRTPETEAPVREISSPDGIKWQYLHGVADPTLVSPDAYEHDAALMARPGQPEIQLDLISDYGSNFALYPAFQEYFRTSQVPLLAVWGGHDEIFVPAGALAFRRDLPGAEIHLLPTGHFALETHADQIARLMRDFLDRHLTTDHG